MGNDVKLILDSDERKLVQAMERAKKVVDRLSQSLEAAGQKGAAGAGQAEGGMNGLGNAVVGVVGRLGVATTAAAALWAGVSKVRDVLADIQRIEAEAASKVPSTASAFGGLAQLAGGDAAKMRDLVAEVDKLAVAGAMRSREEAANLLYRMKTTGQGDQGPLVGKLAKAGIFKDLPGVLESTEQAQKVYGAGAGDLAAQTSRMMALRSIDPATGKPFTGVDAEKLWLAAGRAGATGARVGVDQDWTLAAVTAIAERTGGDKGPMTGGSRVEALLNVAWGKGIKGDLPSILKQLREAKRDPKEVLAGLEAEDVSPQERRRLQEEREKAKKNALSETQELARLIARPDALGARARAAAQRSRTPKEMAAFLGGEENLDTSVALQEDLAAMERLVAAQRQALKQGTIHDAVKVALDDPTIGAAVRAKQAAIDTEVTRGPIGLSATNLDAKMKKALLDVEQHEGLQTAAAVDTAAKTVGDIESLWGLRGNRREERAIALDLMIPDRGKPPEEVLYTDSQGHPVTVGDYHKMEEIQTREYRQTGKTRESGEILAELRGIRDSNDRMANTPTTPPTLDYRDRDPGAGVGGGR